MKEYYICKYRLNAVHSYDGTKEKAHSHTFHIDLYVGSRNPKEIGDIRIVDSLMTRFLEPCQGRFLNELDGFQAGANLENIGDVFYEKLVPLLSEAGFSLYQIEVFENPLFTYRAGDEMLLPIINAENAESNLNLLLSQKRQMESGGISKK